jgi:multidrug efflux system outer membrane protein
MTGWRSVAIVIALFCVGCAGLPPKQPPAQLNNEVPLDGLETVGGGGWPAKEWWKRYQDPTLDQLIELGLASSPTLATAHARYDSARQSVRIAGAESGVRVDASADIDRQRLSDNGLFPPHLLGFTWYNQADLGLQASYTVDWWGKQRDAVEARDGPGARGASGSQRRRIDAREFHCGCLLWLAGGSEPHRACA